ncbi:MAG: gliding motility-associated C-terminal domain-containing protein [Bacteroidota bacterium]
MTQATTRQLLRLFVSLVSIWSCIRLNAQSITFGGNTVFKIGASTSFFAGGNTTFNGSLVNEGVIHTFSDIDFINNTQIGNIKVVGTTSQVLEGGALDVSNLELASTSVIEINADLVRVNGDFTVISGVAQPEEVGTLVVLGGFNPMGGFVEGTLVGVTSNQSVTFPMGVDQYANYITIGNTTPDVIMIVTCQIPPNSSDLIPTEEMVGIADEMEWVVRTDGETIDAQISVDYSGLDFLNFSNGQHIRADVYEPAIVIFQEGDTIYHALTSTEATPRNAASSTTEGRIFSSTAVTISAEPTRISVAWLPVVDDPEFFIPNVFSPNGFYEENRVFRPFFAGAEVSSISMAVYNAFNKPVFQYSNNGNDLDLNLIGWDGKLNGGQNAEEGVYYYVIEIIAGGQIYKKTSSVLLTN